jgi:adenine-specific DNA-methyltransferase
MEQEIAAGNIWFGANGDNVPRIKKFLRNNENKGLTPETIWPAEEVGTNDGANKGLLQLLPDMPVFDNPKPEGLLERVIHIATNPGEIVLDSFAGSGTTGAVAHKMGRRWIMVELGEHCHTHIIPRLRKVIDGEDKGGVTEVVGWQGGGGFRYYRLAPSLLETDKWGREVIAKAYNAAMLAEALCKLEGFTYAPSDAVYWQQGNSTERDFIYVTTQTLSHEQLQQLSEEVGPDRSLLVLCLAFRGNSEHWPNLTVKKIPNHIRARCEWGHDDYSLNVENLPKASPKAEFEQPPSNKANAGQQDLFGAKTGGGR